MLERWIQAGLAVLLLSGAGTARAEHGGFSTSVAAGMLVPAGEWATHRYAPGVKQVGAGPMFGLEIGLRLRSRLALAMRAEYALHSTSAWENYAASRGDRIDASVRTFQGALLIRGAIWTNGRDAVTLGLGPGLISPSGEETFGGVSYSYDFLRTRMGLATDLELDHAVGAATSLVLRGGAIFATKGVQYADGLDRDVATLGLTLGVRFYP